MYKFIIYYVDMSKLCMIYLINLNHAHNTYRVHILNVLKRIYYYCRCNSMGGGMLNYSSFEIGTLI